MAAVAHDAHAAVVTAANAVGTDTDTIVTMAGALLGACDGAGEPPEQPLDSDYLHREAHRLAAVAHGQSVECHGYPDILTWVAPKAPADALVSDSGGLAVEGLGPVTELEAVIVRATSDDFGWQWVMTSFGQTLLIKRRPNLRSPKTGNALAPSPSPIRRTHSNAQNAEPLAKSDSAPRPLDRGVNMNGAIEQVRDHLDDDQMLGYTVRRVARDGTFKDLVSLVTALHDDLRR